MLPFLDRKLALAPVDEEPATADELADIQARIASLKRSGGIPIEVVFAEFGITKISARWGCLPARETWQSKRLGG